MVNMNERYEEEIQEAKKVLSKTINEAAVASKLCMPAVFEALLDYMALVIKKMPLEFGRHGFLNDVIGALIAKVRRKELWGDGKKSPSALDHTKLEERFRERFAVHPVDNFEVPLDAGGPIFDKTAFDKLVDDLFKE
jgi:hypothetical protein